MKLSAHSYNNEVFDSLLDGLKDDIVLKKTAKSNADDSTSKMELFSSTTEEAFDSVQEDELRIIAAELQFAADKSKVAIDGSDLIRFAKEVQKDGLRGKKLERAASKFCGKLNRDIAPPQSAHTVQNIDLVEQASSVVPARYNTEEANDSKTGGYLGMSKNPNTIWDTEALQRFATKTDDRTQMQGDEQIADSRKKEAEYKESLKTASTEEAPEALAKHSLSNISTGQETGTSQELPTNAMSMFDTDRDFGNIPEKTAGEMLKEQSEERSNKKAEAKSEWNKTASVQKISNTNLLDTEPAQEEHQINSVSRAAVDKLFEGFANLNKENN